MVRGLSLGGAAAPPYHDLVGQSCRSAQTSPSASAAWLTESGCARPKPELRFAGSGGKFGRRGSAALPFYTRRRAVNTEQPVIVFLAEQLPGTDDIPPTGAGECRGDFRLSLRA